MRKDEQSRSKKQTKNQNEPGQRKEKEGDSY